MKEKKSEKSEEKTYNKKKNMKNYEESFSEISEELVKIKEQLDIIAKAKIKLLDIEEKKSSHPQDEYTYFYDSENEPVYFKIKENIRLTKYEFEELIDSLMYLRYVNIPKRYEIAIVDYVFDLLHLEIETESKDFLEISRDGVSRQELIKYIKSDLYG